VNSSIPTYSEVMSGDRGLERRIIKPFEKALNHLIDIGLLSNWYYRDADKNKLIPDENFRVKYKEFVDLYIGYEILNGKKLTLGLKAVSLD
jgi:hypothetical protein